MTTDLGPHIAQAKELLRTARHGAIATVNDDGSPHNTPVFIAFDDALRAYWASHPDAVHSRNIQHRGQAYIVLFESSGPGGGLYIQARARQLDTSDELFQPGSQAFNAKRQAMLRETVPASYFTGDQPQHLYVALPEQLWINTTTKDERGYIIQDRRCGITIQDLL